MPAQRQMRIGKERKAERGFMSVKSSSVHTPLIHRA
jgi:hypothetical protein